MVFGKIRLLVIQPGLCILNKKDYFIFLELRIYFISKTFQDQKQRKKQTMIEQNDMGNDVER